MLEGYGDGVLGGKKKMKAKGTWEYKSNKLDQGSQNSKLLQ